MICRKIHRNSQRVPRVEVAALHGQQRRPSTLPSGLDDWERRPLGSSTYPPKFRNFRLKQWDDYGLFRSRIGMECWALSTRWSRTLRLPSRLHRAPMRGIRGPRSAKACRRPPRTPTPRGVVRVTINSLLTLLWRPSIWPWCFTTDSEFSAQSASSWSLKTLTTRSPFTPLLMLSSPFYFRKSIFSLFGRMRINCLFFFIVALYDFLVLFPALDLNQKNFLIFYILLKSFGDLRGQCCDFRPIIGQKSSTQSTQQSQGPVLWSFADYALFRYTIHDESRHIWQVQEHTLLWYLPDRSQE